MSFSSFAKQYRKYVADMLRDKGKKTKDTEIKLYITKIENNCILVELAGAAGTLFSAMNYTNIFVDFTEHINNKIHYFRKLATENQPKTKASDIPYSKEECKDHTKFLEPIVKNKDGVLGISVAEFTKETETEKIHTKFEFSSAEASKSREGALSAQRILEETVKTFYQNVLMYFHQTNVDESKADGRTEEKAVINSIDSKALPVYIISPLDRKKINSLKSDPKMNMFTVSYRVDVNVEKDKNDIPKFYRILEVHEIIPDDES